MKSKVRVFQFPAEMTRDSHFMTALEVKEALPKYELTAIFYGEGEDDDLCEEAFDLSNNPSRQEQRGFVFGHTRSVSVGDVVQINSRAYMCGRIGWVPL